MATVPLILDRSCRVNDEHTVRGELIELEGVDPKTGELVGEARSFVARGWAHLAEGDEVKAKGAKAPKAAAA